MTMSLASFFEDGDGDRARKRQASNFDSAEVFQRLLSRTSPDDGVDAAAAGIAALRLSALPSSMKLVESDVFSSEDDEDRRDPASLKAAMKRAAAAAVSASASASTSTSPRPTLTRAFGRLVLASAPFAAEGEGHACRGCGQRFALRRTRDLHAARACGA